MEKEQYIKNCYQIVELVDGMTASQWDKIKHLITHCYEDKKVKVSFEKPEHLDLLMKQNFIT